MRSTMWLVLLAVAPAFGAPPAPVIIDAVTSMYRPIAPDQTRLAGLLASRMRANSEGYLEHFAAKVAAPLENPASGDQERAAAVESAGQLLEAATDAYAYSQHPLMRPVMDRLAKDLIAWRPMAPVEGIAEQHFSDYGWAFNYDLLGLLSYYRLTNNADALAAVRKASDIAIKNWDSEPQHDAAAVSRYAPILEGMVYAYRYTGEQRLLDFCRALGERVARIQPVSPPTYQSLSELVGLLELYRITGDEAFFRPVLSAWSDTEKSHLSITGTIRIYGGDLADSCTTATWMKLTANLLRITGQARYGQELERTLYNQLLAAQDPRNGNTYRPVPLNGAKNPAPPDDACSAAEARTIAYIPEFAWGRYGNGIAVVLYTAGRATFQLRRRGMVQLYSESAYPAGGDILLHVEPAHKIQFPLRLRVPEWADDFSVSIAGSRLVGRPGEFLTINRAWKRGDTLKITIPLSMRMVQGHGEYANDIALERGPQILALGKAVNPDIGDLADARLATADVSQLNSAASTAALPGSWAGDQAYDVPGEYRGKRQELVFVPFADAVTYRVWLPRPAEMPGRGY